MRVTPLGRSSLQKMHERIDPSLGNHRVMFDIVACVEHWIRISPAGGPEPDKMVQRIHRGVRFVTGLFGAKIINSIEQRMRVASFQRAKLQEMIERINPGDCYVGISLKIIRGVEQRMRIISARDTEAPIVLKGAEPGGSYLIISFKIPRTVEQRVPILNFCCRCTRGWI